MPKTLIFKGIEMPFDQFPETPAPTPVKAIVTLVLRPEQSGAEIEDTILSALLNAPYLMRKVDAIHVDLA